MGRSIYGLFRLLRGASDKQVSVVVRGFRVKDVAFARLFEKM